MLSTSPLLDSNSLFQQEDTAWKSASSTTAIRQAVRWRKKCGAYFASGNYDKALLSISKAIEFDSQDTLSRKCESHLLYKLDRFGDAIESLHKGLELDPHDSWFWESYVDLLCDEKRFEEANEAVERSRVISDSQGLPWLLEGIIACSHGRFEDAVKNFKEALGDDTTQVRARKWNKKALKALRVREEDVLKEEEKINENPEESMPKGKGITVTGPIRHPGEIIREELVEQQGMRREYIANEIGVDGNYFRSILTKKYPLTEKIAKKLCERFNLSISEENLMIQQVRWKYAQKANRVSKTKNKKTSQPTAELS